MKNKKVVWALVVFVFLAVWILGKFILKVDDKNFNMHGFKKVEEKVYDVPAKTQYSLRATMDSTATKEDIEIMLKAAYSNAMETKYKYRNPPSHVFIYIYSDTIKDFQANWKAMYSRIDNKDYGIEFAQ